MSKGRLEDLETQLWFLVNPEAKTKLSDSAIPTQENMDIIPRICATLYTTTAPLSKVLGSPAARHSSVSGSYEIPHAVLVATILA